MKFIERTFPVEYINPVAMSEGNAKKPVYRMHKWWARRLGSVFRSIVLSVFNPYDRTEAEVWRQFCDGAHLEGKIVLDPFMGGGTTIAEALRLGCRVIGADINPVAWFVTKKEIEPVDFNDLAIAFRRLEETAGAFIKQYYRTKGICGHDADVMYFFWVKVTECAHCGHRIRLFPNYELSRRDHINVSLCPRCLQIVETSGYDPHTKCSECGEVFDPREGVSGRGIFQCPICGTRERLLDAVKRKGGALDVEMHALEYYCETCGRGFKRVDNDDIALWEKARREFELRKERLLFPRQAIPTEGRSDPRPVNHGYQYFWQMFNERQLLCLSTLLEEILRLSDRNLRELMLIAFSDCLDTNNMFCKYEIQWHKISPFFGLHAYHPIERPTENNVWGTRYGRCTFTKCFEKVRRAKEYCQAPYERLLDLRGKRFSKRTGNERIEGSLADDFPTLLRAERGSMLRCGSSEDLSFIPSKSVDAVITDPPYFDNVMYSELADFFYVWLRLGLKDAYPWFDPELSNRSREMVKNDRMGKTTEFFSRGLQAVFAECHRVLKDDGVMVFTFHHNKIWAWESMERILLDAEFYISATPIIRSEGKSGYHSSKGNIRYDACLVCRKRLAEPSGHEWTSLKGNMLDDAVAWTRRTLASGMPVNEVDIFTIVMAKTIEHHTKHFPEIADDGRRVSAKDAIAEMNGIVQTVAERVKPEEEKTDIPYQEQCEQLSFLLRESRELYG